VIGQAMGQQLRRDLPGAFDRCRRHITASDVWYGADILGERVPGPALVSRFRPALERLAPWREDENARLRRAGSWPKARQRATVKRRCSLRPPFVSHGGMRRFCR